MRSELAQQMVSNFAAASGWKTNFWPVVSLLKDNLVAQMNAMSSREQQQFSATPAATSRQLTGRVPTWMQTWSNS